MFSFVSSFAQVSDHCGRAAPAKAIQANVIRNFQDYINGTIYRIDGSIILKKSNKGICGTDNMPSGGFFHAHLGPDPIRKNGMLLFTLPEAGMVVVLLMDSKGLCVPYNNQTVETYAAGTHTMMLDFNNLSSGAYWLRLICASKVEVLKFEVLK